MPFVEVPEEFMEYNNRAVELANKISPIIQGEVNAAVLMAFAKHLAIDSAHIQGGTDEVIETLRILIMLERHAMGLCGCEENHEHHEEHPQSKDEPKDLMEELDNMLKEGKPNPNSPWSN